jgi:hypothetical protein
LTDDQQHSSDNPDAGEPIAELARLRVQPSRNFLQRVHASLDRRALAINVLEFCLLAFLEFLTAIASLILGDRDGRHKPGV